MLFRSDCLRAVNEHARLAEQVAQLRAALVGVMNRWVGEGRNETNVQGESGRVITQARDALAATEGGAS